MDKTVHDITSLRYNDLIAHYVAVCNEALRHNRDRFPFKQILGAAQASGDDNPIEVNVIGEKDQESYVFRLSENGITAEPHGACGSCHCIRSWSVEKSYLEDVIKTPECFIENPAKINWEWMYDE